MANIYRKTDREVAWIGRGSAETEGGISYFHQLAASAPDFGLPRDINGLIMQLQQLVSKMNGDTKKLQAVLYAVIAKKIDLVSQDCGSFKKLSWRVS